MPNQLAGIFPYDSLIDRLLFFDYGGVLLADLFGLDYRSLKSTAEFCMLPAEIRSLRISYVLPELPCVLSALLTTKVFPQSPKLRPQLIF